MTGVPQIFQAITLISYLFFHWKGALDHESIKLKVFVNRNHIIYVQQWYLIYFEDQTENYISQQLPLVQTLDPIQISLDGLKPYTKYNYLFHFDQLSKFNSSNITNNYEIFWFKTLQTPYLKQNLSFSFSSCAKTGSEDHVFQDIIDLFPDHQFFIQMGDIYYGDIIQNQETLYDESYYRMFESKSQSKFYQYYGLVYIWDDHDFGDNNSGESSPGKQAATSVYLKNVPHYPLRYLPQDLPQKYLNSEGIYQYFIAGQTLFVIMDLRTHFRDGVRAMDQNQLMWVIEILDWCKQNQKIDNLVVVSSIPWLGKDWVTFKEQRTIIGNKMAEVMKAKQNVLLITGDSHMVAFDNGYNNDAGGFPHCISSPMDKTPSCKGGQYTFGPFSGNSQYSTLDITYDPATNINCFIVKGWRGKDVLYNYNSCNQKDRELKTSNSCFTSVLQIFINTFVPLLLILVVLVLIWRYTLRFSNQLSHQQVAQQYINLVKKDDQEQNQNLHSYTFDEKQNKQPGTAQKKNSASNLNEVEREKFMNQEIPPNQLPTFLNSAQNQKSVENI
ncbi:PhoD-like phosphatase (macronuclear) [Tetrahymena thermophila SB210]|uniref:PhoD-like phosphatase n=1 Tax=Tetrahymena thermophila (strain SB210) TaxID=312017 RepID=I7MJV6_TETTS|nr:PhoD-like phosphatase [Tetrahymena thermophila SB210]EAS07543.2 PhoD-like phosphatase [Tetrahymena thermophila SB210]|eukprot:XP_001027785.2 PhoD-like phosphatase [Tetrahymena thermophila SB210]